MIVEFIVLLLIGLIAGFSSGLIGIGGGLFYIILYSFYLKQYDFASENDFVNMVVVNSIFSTFFAGLSASMRQIKLNNFYWRPSLLIGIAGLFASIFVTHFVTEREFYNKKVFAVVFTLAILPLMYKMIHKPKDVNRDIHGKSNMRLAIVGLASGIGTALSGLGGAFIITPMLNGMYQINIKKVVSVAVGAIVVVAGGMSIFNLLHQSYTVDIPYTFGGIHFFMVMPVILAILISAPIGVQVSKKMDAKYIRAIFLLFCIAIIIRNTLELFY